MDIRKLDQLTQAANVAIDRLAESGETLEDKEQIVEALNELKENIEYAVGDLEAEIEKEQDEEEEDDN